MGENRLGYRLVGKRKNYYGKGSTISAIPGAVTACVENGRIIRGREAACRRDPDVVPLGCKTEDLLWEEKQHLGQTLLR